MTKQVEQLDRVIIRFAGDSGDGMQLTGDRFTQETATFGNDLSTLPNFPAEIRAPAGTLPGVSSFQLHFADHDILTPGDAPDVLVAMNPAALRANLARPAQRRRPIIVDTHDFTARNLTRAGYDANPLEDGTLDSYTVHAVDLTSMTVEAVKEFGLSRKDAARAKNMFALGLLSWLYGRPVEGDRGVPRRRFAVEAGHPRRQHRGVQGRLELRRDDRDVRRLLRDQAGPDAHRHLPQHLRQPGAELRPGRRVGRASGLPLFLGAYPITPASDILHELSKHKRFGVMTFQAEDEIAGIGAALGASFGGALGVTTTSGPGIALKGETIGLAVSLELPLIVVDVQRGGPSTGLPTKTEQSDLLQAMFGRNGEAPVPIVAPQSPGDCFDAAARGGPDRGHLPHAGDPALRRLPRQRLRAVAAARPRRAARRSTRRSPPSPTTRPRRGDREFWPYQRDPETLARPWAIPGTPGWSTGSAASRRPTATATSRYDPDQPRPDGAHPAGQGRPDRRHHRPARGRRPRRRGPGARARLGFDVRTDRRGLPAAAQPGPARSRRRTCATSTRSRTPRRGAARATTGSSSRR